MELVSGEPVTDFCDRQSLSIGDRLDLFVQICRAVQHAHLKGLIHRDIKPSNILVSTQDGRPFAKVIDFGIAKATDSRLTEKTVFTEQEQLIGTPQYMSPEQAEGSVDIDTRTDIYSLGVLLYELLTGATPFDGRELRSKAYAEMQRIIREVDPPTPSTRVSTSQKLPSIAAQRSIDPKKLTATVRGELDWIVMKCLEKDRTRRYESPSALAGDVMHYLADEPVAASPPSTLYRFRKFVRRNRTLVTASALLLLVLVGGIVTSTYFAIRAARERAEAQRQAQEASRQTQISDAVAAFQSDMLGSADPGKLLGDKVTVLQAVSAAEKELDAGKLKSQPLVEAAVREMIGNTLRSLGRFNDAEPQLRKALQLRRAELPPGHLDIGLSLSNLGLLLCDQSKAKEAEIVLRESLALRRAALPAGHPVIAQGLQNLSNALFIQGSFADAERLSREALAINQAASPLDEKELAINLSNLGLLLKEQHRYTDAQPFLLQALEIQRRHYPSGHPAVAGAADSLAQIFQAQGKLVEAEALFRESLEINRKLMPEVHPSVARSLSNLAMVLYVQGRFAEAEPLALESTQMCRKVYHADHPDLASSLGGLATVLTAERKFDQAEPLWQEALRIARVSLPANHPDHAILLQNLAAMYRSQGRLAEAEQAYRQTVPLLERLYGSDAWETGVCRACLGLTLMSLRRHAEAETALLDALRAFEASNAQGARKQCIASLIELYTTWDQSEPGKGYDAKAQQWQERLPVTRPATSQALN
jgi:tetratricopeptide (TPR) repeat protein